MLSCRTIILVSYKIIPKLVHTAIINVVYYRSEDIDMWSGSENKVQKQCKIILGRILQSLCKQRHERSANEYIRNSDLLYGKN
jgi:hypothetical protein